MKQAIFALVLTTFLAALVGCNQNEPAKSAGTSVAPSETPVAAVATPAAKTASPAANGQAAGIQTPTEEVTEDTNETDENVESGNALAAKDVVAPLKLAQLPPRSSAASRFKEGVNYTRLSPTQPVDVSPDQVEIVEFFWYGCPHCNALDPKVEAWRKSKPPGGKADYVVFRRLPATWNDITRFHGRFYFAAESLGRLDELHPLIFNEIHVNGNPLNTVDKAREFFAAHGVDAQAFQKSFGAMSVERSLDNANTLAQRYRITGVPTFVINGKFTADVGTAGGEEQLFALLNELAAREHARE